MSYRAKSIFTDGTSTAFPFSLDTTPSVFGGEVHLASASGETVMRVESDDGFGEMRFTEVLPGITVSFNDFHMGRCICSFSTESDVLCIDWCREGRIEQPVPGGSYAYVSSGDLKVDDRASHTGEFVFPTRRYRGVTISFDLSFAPDSIRKALPGFAVDLFEVKRRFCKEGRPFFLHANKQASHIAAELYLAPVKVRKAYCQIKSLELLLFLDSLEPDLLVEGTEYYPRSKVARVKEAHDLMVSNLSESITVEQAAKGAGMSLTAFKQCFRGVYGSSPAAYVRTVRMELAAKMLRETDANVSEIGAQVGYESPSKFSVAFKGFSGVTPSEYRRRE